MKNVALFIDHENFNNSFKSKVEKEEDDTYSRTYHQQKSGSIRYTPSKITEILENKFGAFRIAVGKLYAMICPRFLNENIYSFGIEFEYAPVFFTKSMADPMWICDIMETLYEKSIDVFVIVSSDRDLIPLLRKLAAKNKEVYVIVGSLNKISDSDNTSVSDILINECKRLNITVIDYSSLIPKRKCNEYS